VKTPTPHPKTAFRGFEGYHEVGEFLTMASQRGDEKRPPFYAGVIKGKIKEKKILKRRQTD